MAESAQVKRISIRHEAIMDFLMINPTWKLGDVARNFGVTQAWLSTVIHSDAFQEMLREKQDIAFHHTVLPLREKLMAVADAALDKLIEVLPMETETRNLSAVATGVLEKLGYGSKAAVNINVNTVQNTQVNVLRSELEEARLLLGKAGGSSLPSPPLEVSINGERAPIALPRENVSRVGSAPDFSAFHTLATAEPT